MVNRKYAKIVDGRIVFAPAVIRVNGRTIIGGKAEHYAQAEGGPYYPVDILWRPECPEGYHLVSRGYSDEGGVVRLVFDVVKDDPVYRTFSKLKCYSELVAIGKWPAVKTWLEANGLWDAFVLAQDVTEDNPLFRQGLAAMQELLGLTSEDVEAFLAKCVAD